MKKIKLKDTVLFVFFLSVVVKIAGLLKDLIFSWAWGVSITSDAYVIASTIPTYLTMLITTGVTTCFIPIYISLKEKKGSKESIEYSNKIINVIFIICTIIVGLSMIFTKQLVMIFASGFAQETLNLTISLTRITIFEIFSIAMIAVFTGLLQTEKKYYIVLISTLILQLFYCIGAYISKKYSINVLAYAGLIGYIVQIIILIFATYKTGYKYSFTKELIDNNVIHTLNLLIPIIISSSASEISKIVDKTLASHVQSGGVTMLNYANKIDDTIIAIFTTSIITIAYPMIVKAVANIGEKEKETKNIITDYMILLLIMVVPLSIGSIIFSEEIIRLIFLRGAFAIEYLKPTSIAFSAYALGITFYTIRKYISRVFYAFHETKIPTRNSIFSIILNIAFSIVLSFKYGIIGIALGTSISAIIASISILILLYKKKIKIDIKKISIYTIKIILCGLICVLISKYIYIRITEHFPNNIGFLISAFASAVLYIISILIVGMKRYLLLLKK